MSSKSKDKRRPINQTQAIKAALDMFLWAYCNVYDPDVADMENMAHEIQSVMEGVHTGRVSLREIREALYEERGWKIL